MVIRGTANVTCPGCGKQQDCPLVQTIDPRENPADKQLLLDGELNMLACTCGKRTQLAANVLFRQGEYTCQVVPGGEKAMEEAAAAFAASGIGGTRRLVPSLNALVEKVKLLDASLDDHAIEMTKVLLLASIGELERVLLFETLDKEAGVIRWAMFDEDGRPERVSSPVAQYEKLAQRPQPDTELRVDRAWAIEAVKAMVANAN
ncbi:MAG TPA: CpXC domain-containing protein [Kofleriaceae bacterium]|nr:CpXC domain-containing protein [Kofleriaceae bacterium]